MKDRYNIRNIDLKGNNYVVKQSLLMNKYKLLDPKGNVVLKGKQKMFKMKEEFPFVNGQGQDAFTVKAEGVLDVAGSYVLVDSETDNKVVVLDEEFSLFTENWTVKDPDTGNILAKIKSKNKAISALRTVSDLANIAPNKYEVFNAEDKKIGEIAGELSIRDTYEVSIDEGSDVPREPVMASACVIDALENRE